MDWLVLSKDMVLLSGRELGQNVHPEVATFSVAVGREMAPAFHMVVHAQTSRGEIVSGKSTKGPTWPSAGCLDVTPLFWAT